MREPKRRWALHHINAWGEASAWPRFTFTARGFDKALKKLGRKLDRHRGVAILIEMHPESFRLEIDQ